MQIVGYIYINRLLHGKMKIRSFVIYAVYRIVLDGEIKENKEGGPCGTYSGYRNEDGF